MSETAYVRFLQWSSLYEKERPFQIFTELLPESNDQRKTNLVWDERQIEVKNFRANAERYQLDTHGFSTRHLPGFRDLMDKETIIEKYLPAVQEMLQSQLQDVGTVFVYDWRIRNSRPETTDEIINFSDQTQPLLPSNYAHIDAGPVSIFQRIQNSFPANTDKIIRQRIRAVNVWKPLCNPVEEWALAVCDGTTVKPDDLVETDSVRQGSVSTNYYAKYAPDQQWYYLKHQSPDEALIFKHFDSEPGVRAPYALHASIRQDVPIGVKPRQSIEVRTLLFSEKFESEGEICV
ncbi:hypothetical protein F5B22DRAFT_451839 [Xylaria bambusicola]|uniref:uncharacterized protein n=1 Tax=Xylaria bambusicola TaxID=326684 RepID=UPI00200797BF|nr:uncharacterized protein F5B22DRAFT_451839 [Xylaria bambusicola]KAI0506382.1 hypothetical protein F5B22DRAFT_451839 [Xylaria bambusicola]